MKVLKEGAAHRHIAYFVTCDTCESDLRILVGDPMSSETECYNCDRRQYWIRYICPVCGGLKIAKTGSIFDSFGKSSANSERKEVILNREDREEMETWISESDIRGAASEEEKEWLANRMAP